MQRATVPAVFPLVEALEEFQHLGGGDAGPVPQLAEGGDARAARQHGVAQVERHHGDRHPRAENDVGGVRIDIDVEFGRRRGVAALEEAAAHQHDFPDARGDVGRAGERGGDVGERPQRAQRHRLRGVAADGFDDEIHPVLRLRRDLRVWQGGAIEPGLAVHIFGGDEFALQRPLAPGMHRHLGASCQFHQFEAVQQRQPQRHVARHRDDPQDLQVLRRSQRGEDRDGVVLTGVSVDDDFPGHAGGSSAVGFAGPA